MHADLRLHEQAMTARSLTPMQAFAAVAGVLVAVLAAFAPTTLSMVEIWRRTETFTHGFLVIPVVLGFVWLRRADLARIPVRPARSALPLLLAAGLLWLLGKLSSSLAPSQLAVVAMVPATVAALFGWGWVRALAFPLAFLFFAVPFGEVFVPTLIDWTADFTVAAVAASGVPVYREANNFVIPSGRWSVVEACSGIRYLIASLMLGSLYAWMAYRSTRKRIAFIAAAIAVPLVANWLRAYGIVMLGHLSGNRIATGVDHLIYGWLFFGALMLAMFTIGARWRDPPRDGAVREAPDKAPADPVRRSSLALHGALALVAVAIWPVADAALERRLDPRPVGDIQIAPAHGWQRADDDGLLGGWRPDAAGAARTEALTFVRDGRRVTVFVAVYRNQRQGAELVSSANQLVHPTNERWRVAARAARTLTDADGSFPAQAAVVRGPNTAVAAAQWYWLGSRRTVSDVRAKMDLALDRLLMRNDTSAWIVVATPVRDGLRDGWPVIDAFVRDMGTPLQRGLQEMAADGES